MNKKRTAKRTKITIKISYQNVQIFLKPHSIILSVKTLLQQATQAFVNTELNHTFLKKATFNKPKISKRGNRYLRKAMHLRALTAVKWDENFKEIYARLISRHGIKMKALVAIQRKMLELIYIIFKNETNYDKEYRNKNNAITQNA